MRLSCLHNCATPLPRRVLAGLPKAFFTVAIAPVSRSAHTSPSGGGLCHQGDYPPTGKPINQVVVDVFRRTSNQQTVFDLFGVFVLRPAIASFAERDFVPLRVS